jgi:hypothetical protein
MDNSENSDNDEIGERTPLTGSGTRLSPIEEPTGCGASLICDPRRSVHRYFVLIFICFLSFGEYGMKCSCKIVNIVCSHLPNADI